MWISSMNSTLEVEFAGQIGRGGSGKKIGEEGEKERTERGGGESGNNLCVEVEWGESDSTEGGGSVEEVDLGKVIEEKVEEEEMARLY